MFANKCMNGAAGMSDIEGKATQAERVSAGSKRVSKRLGLLPRHAARLPLETAGITFRFGN
jgi:hypothetical protein